MAIKIRLYRLTAVGASLLAVSNGCARTTASRNTVTPSPVKLMTPADLNALPSKAPDYRLAYGADPNQYGELRIPSQRGPHPVVVLVHGGCWKAAYASAHYLSPMADALKAEGIATWNIEYRRLYQPGSGWPGTYLDVGRAVDHLRLIAQQYQLDLHRVIIVGHSAGGHLAMWLAGRQRLAEGSAVYVANPLPIRGVINLAGTMDMADNILKYESLCRDTVVTAMLGGTPTAVPERYTQASAINLVPLGVLQVLVLGTREEYIPLPVAEKYVNAATRAGDSVKLLLIPGAGHFEIASPFSPAWPVVRSAITSLLAGKLPN